MKKYFYDVIRYKFCKFSGRADRKEFWLFHLWYALIMFFLYLAVAIPAFLVMTSEEETVFLSIVAIFFSICIILFSLLTLLPSLALAARRLHDANLTAWLLLLIIVFPPILIIYGILPPSLGNNQYEEKELAE